jgi:sulfite dehydrogenase (cytochrome) subunit A
MMSRRTVLQGGAALLAGGGVIGGSSLTSFAAEGITLPIGNGERPLAKYPQKRPMIGLTQRPPQLETPFSIFNDGPITPNCTTNYKSWSPEEIPNKLKQ